MIIPGIDTGAVLPLNIGNGAGVSQAVADADATLILDADASKLLNVDDFASETLIVDADPGTDLDAV